MLPARQAELMKSNYSTLRYNETESNIRQDHTCLCHSPLYSLRCQERDTIFLPIQAKPGHTLPSPADPLPPGSALSVEEK